MVALYARNVFLWKSDVFWNDKFQTLEQKSEADKDHLKEVIVKIAVEAEKSLDQEKLKLNELVEEINERKRKWMKEKNSEEKDRHAI